LVITTQKPLWNYNKKGRYSNLKKYTKRYIANYYLLVNKSPSIMRERM